MLTNVIKLKIETLKKIYKNITKMQIKFANYINKKRKNTLLFKEGNKIYFFAKISKKKQKQKIKLD